MQQVKALSSNLHLNPYYIAFEVLVVIGYIFLIWYFNHQKLTDAERFKLREMVKDLDKPAEVNQMSQVRYSKDIYIKYVLNK